MLYAHNWFMNYFVVSYPENCMSIEAADLDLAPLLLVVYYLYPTKNDC